VLSWGGGARRLGEECLGMGNGALRGEGSSGEVDFLAALLGNLGISVSRNASSMFLNELHWEALALR